MIIVVIPGSKREGTSWRLVLRDCQALLEESQKGKDEEGMHLEDFEDGCVELGDGLSRGEEMYQKSSSDGSSSYLGTTGKSSLLGRDASCLPRGHDAACPSTRISAAAFRTIS
jgi:hypothetical protein